MIGAIHIRKQGATPGILAKQRNRIQKASFYKIGTHWHRQYLPEHFKNSAMSRYAPVYKPRKGQKGNEEPQGFKRSYTGRKLKRFGHTLPLVFTGESRRLAKIRDVRATSRGNRVVIHARKFNFRHPKSRIKMYEEATAFAPVEVKDLREVFGKTFQAGINTIQTREEKRVV